MQGCPTCEGPAEVPQSTPLLPVEVVGSHGFAKRQASHGIHSMALLAAGMLCAVGIRFRCPHHCPLQGAVGAVGGVAAA